MKKSFNLVVLCAAALLTACEEDPHVGEVNGLPVYCNSLGSTSAAVAHTCIGCEIANPQAAGDGNFRSAANVQVFASPDRGGAALVSSTFFLLPGDAGDRPGAFIRLPRDPSGVVSWTTVRIRISHSFAIVGEETAQIGSELGLVEGGLKRADLPAGSDPSLPETYVYFDAESAFDHLEVEFAAPGVRTAAAQVEVFELCEDGGLL